jgi:NTE family protein
MKLGVALGGGGVRGLAHISVLEALDELGIKPDIIAGTSMGAIVGALYASGMPASEIREEVRTYIILEEDGWREILDKREKLWKWVDWFSIDFSRGGLVSVRGFLESLLEGVMKATFEELETPLLVVAADYWTAEEIVFETGKLLPAIQASMAVPGVFAPVSVDGRVLVDGGAVNLVPYDHLLERVDTTIAVDVSRHRMPDTEEIPNALESVLGTFNIMQSAALAERLKHHTPDFFIRPDIRDVRMLEFGKIDAVFTQAKPVVEALKKELSEKYINQPE